MSHKTAASRKPRIYRSPLRDEGKIQTRERIIEALVQVLARNGIANFSMSLVAKEAKVSLPSVYRYFRTKRDLFAALDDYKPAKAGLSFPEFPRSSSPRALGELIPTLFQSGQSIEPAIASALRTRVGYDICRTPMQELNSEGQAWLRDIVFVLTSHGCLSAFKDCLGLDTDGAAARVAWAICVLAGEAQSGGEPGASK